MSERRKIVPVLLAGGTGTRLWPLSREAYPKQFIKLLDERSLLQATAQRAAAIAGATAPIIICGDAHRFIVAEQLRQIGIDDATIILEPEGRNTAPAAAIAALHVASIHGDDALLFVMSADHAVGNEGAFVNAALQAAAVAAAGHIVTFGIRPTRAETGYGYLQRGDALPQGGYKVARFIEKPPLDDARRYVADGNHDWNGGLFLFPAQLLLSELKALQPAMLAACEDALAGSAHDLDFLRLDAKAFARIDAESIDYAVMEKTQHAALVPMDADWDDIGAWTFMDKLPKDARGNVTRGDVLLEDVDNSLIHSQDRLVAVTGVRDVLVVETSDAVLVTNRESAQKVKDIVRVLNSLGRSEARMHPEVHRPWGSYQTIAHGDRFQVKKILVKPGHKLSAQMHHHRAEHWVVVRGTARVSCNGKEFLLSENESTFIPLGETHRLENPGKVPLELIEVQSGAYLSEDDIVRFEDDFGRTTSNSLSPGPSPTSGRGELFGTNGKAAS